MADVHDKATRSYNMSRVKSKNTKPEIIVRKYLHSKGLRYSLHSNWLVGRPDMVLAKYRTVIFINGCFWHGHSGCKKAKLPISNADWWKAKIELNVNRDTKNIDHLTNAGWQVITIWECELLSDDVESVLFKVRWNILNNLPEKFSIVDNVKKPLTEK